MSDLQHRTILYKLLEVGSRKQKLKHNHELY